MTANTLANESNNVETAAEAEKEVKEQQREECAAAVGVEGINWEQEFHDSARVESEIVRSHSERSPRRQQWREAEKEVEEQQTEECAAAVGVEGSNWEREPHDSARAEPKIVRSHSERSPRRQRRRERGGQGEGEREFHAGKEGGEEEEEGVGKKSDSGGERRDRRRSHFLKKVKRKLKSQLA